MKTLVIFDSQFGNTERLAEVIAQRLGAGQPVWAADGAAKAALELRDWDLLMIGAPTQNHTVSPTMRALLQGASHGALKDARVAVFDTRYRMARILSGSAADWMAAHFRRAGATLVVAPESFFVERDVPPPSEQRRHEHERLEAGEEERALAWASAVGVTEQAPAPASSDRRVGGLKVPSVTRS
jgi:flavodoxin